jgi:hypothetical protein
MAFGLFCISFGNPYSRAAGDSGNSYIAEDYQVGGGIGSVALVFIEAVLINTK